MKHIALVAFGLVCSSTIAHATVTTFTSASDFFTANPSASLIENFEDSDPALRYTPLSSYTGPGGEITFTPISSYPYNPNIFLIPPGANEPFGPGVHPTSIVMAAIGNEDFVGTLATPTYALGFDVLRNAALPLVLSFFDGQDLLGTIVFDTPPPDGNYYGFAGITSTQPITSFRWTANDGQNYHTAIDNVYAGPAVPGVPEPGTWAMMLIGFGAVGAALRWKRTRLPATS